MIYFSNPIFFQSVFFGVQWFWQNISKVRFWGNSGFSLALNPIFQFFPRFFTGVPAGRWVTLRSASRAFWLVWCPPYLNVAFNKIIYEAEGREALLTDLEITHYQQGKPWEKKGKNSRHGP